MAHPDYLWWRDGIIYQIYPRSFCDTSGNGIGDLRGIIEKLDYLAELGIDAIWLSPINPSPDVDFGYDVSDYFSIDPKFGSMADFDLLVKTAKKKGIRIIMDLVLNHSSDQHPWFQESKSSRDHPRRDWYIWQDGKGNHRPPNNWLSVFGGSAWEWDETSGQYYLHLFYKEQPDLNWRHPQVRKKLLDIFRFWLDKGVGGFRLDVFNLYYKDFCFRDNPARPLRLRPDQRQIFQYNCDLPEMAEALTEIREILDDYQGAYVVGETFLPTPDKAAGYCGKNLLHQAFLFEFLECRWKAECFAKSIRDWQAALGPENWPNYVLNNHDIRRSASRYGRGENDERLKVAAAMLLTLRGTPFLYYGEEIGVREVTLSRSQIKDPVGLRFWPLYKGRDGCRTPMQWDSSTHAGFSRDIPWLPLHPDWQQRNVKKQLADPDSLLNFYRSLIKLRREENALVSGELEFIQGMPGNVLAYQRLDGKSKVEVYLNFGHSETILPVNYSAHQKVFSNKRVNLSAAEQITLMPDEALIICGKA